MSPATRPTLAEAMAYAAGVCDGASFYGAGSCQAYVMPEDEALMRQLETPEEVERALREAGA